MDCICDEHGQQTTKLSSNIDCTLSPIVNLSPDNDHDPFDNPFAWQYHAMMHTHDNSYIDTKYEWISK